MKKYSNPALEILKLEGADIITTSDIQAGIETPPTEAGSGSWESL